VNITPKQIDKNALNRLIINQQLETRIKRVVGNDFAKINNYLHEKAKTSCADVLSIKECYVGYLAQVECGLITIEQARQLTDVFAQTSGETQWMPY